VAVTKLVCCISSITDTLHTYIQPTLPHTLHTAQTHSPIPYDPPRKPTQAYIIPTKQPYKGPYTLHTNSYIPTNPYIPTLPLHTYPTPTTYNYNPYNSSTRHCMSALPLHTCTMSGLQTGSLRCANDGYYVLRHLLANLLHLNLIVFV
jgi:hypothetical protein